MLGRLITRRFLSSKNYMKELPFKFIVKNGKITDIKLLGKIQNLIGTELTNVKSFPETYYLNSYMIQEKVQKQINKNIHLL